MSDDLDLFDYAERRDPPARCDVSGIPADVLALFDKLALHLVAQGYARYSADAILHRIRWHFQIERGVRDFKCNDHWTARLSRWFMERHPELDGFFETRVARSAHDMEVGR